MGRPEQNFQNFLPPCERLLSAPCLTMTAFMGVAKGCHVKESLLDELAALLCDVAGRERVGTPVTLG